MSDKKSVLFLCTGNSARSQMAEGLLRHLAGEQFEVHSAGLEPRGVHPLAVEVMLEIGVDISAHVSKDARQFLGRVPINHCIILCEKAERDCPSIYPFATEKLYWPFEDPAEVDGDDDAQKEAFRRARDGIRAKLEAWLAGESLTPDECG